MSHNARRLVMLLTLAIIAASWWALKPPADKPADYGATTPVAPGPAATSATALADQTFATEQPQRQPPAQERSAESTTNTLVAEQPALQSRWQAGDRDAGWQAYISLQNCVSWHSAETMANVARTAESTSSLTHMKRFLEPLAEPGHKGYCRGVESYSPARAFQMLLAMAERGDLQAQLQFTLDPPLFRLRALAELDLILRYRERAPHLLQRALEAGSQQALKALLDAHTPAQQHHEPGASMFTTRPSYAASGLSAVAYLQRFSLIQSTQEFPHQQILQPDPAQAYVLALVCQRACTDSLWLQRANRVIADSELQFDAEARLQLSLRAQRLLLRSFRQRVNEEPVRWGAWWNAI